jgi:hypothetical protein
MNQLEQRKRALVAESEVYRQTLNLEIQNLRLCILALEQKVKQYKGLFTFIPLASSLVGMLSGGLFRRRRKAGWRRLLGSGILGWRFYRKFGPMFQSALAQWLARKRTASSPAEERTPAANI